MSRRSRATKPQLASWLDFDSVVELAAAPNGTPTGSCVMARRIEKIAMIQTVELARGIAALMVVVFHANASAIQFGGPQPAWLNFAEHGVDFFFVLSGFIIYTAHGHELGASGAARTYLLKRFIRLIPPLWIVVVGWSALRWLAGQAPDPITVLRSLLLWPSLEPTIPTVVWTLRHEALFYFVFLLALVRPWLGFGVFLLWGVGAVVQLALSAKGSPVGGLPSFFLSTFTLDFMLGIAIGVLHARFKFRSSYVPLASAVVVLLAVLVAGYRFEIHRSSTSDYVSLAATWWTLVLGITFAAVLHGLVCIESVVSVPKAGLFLGAASYTIYLLHTIVNSFSQRLAMHLPESLKAIGAGHVLLILAGTLVSVLFYIWLEKPLTRTLRRKLLRSQ